MDNHDKAHYGIAAGAFAAIASMYAMMPAASPGWPKLSAGAAQKIVVMTGQNPLDVYCADADCNKITHALIAGGKAKGVAVHTTALLGGEDGLSVGAPTQAQADQLKRAVEEGSGGVLKVADAVPGQPTYYISFGHIARDNDK